MKDGFLKVGVASVDVEVANPIHNKEKVMETIETKPSNGPSKSMRPLYELVCPAATVNDFQAVSPIFSNLTVSPTESDNSGNQLYFQRDLSPGSVTLNVGDMLHAAGIFT